MSRCKRCGCERGPHAEGDECTNRGWCELTAAVLADATEEDWLIADAIGALAELDSKRKRKARRDAR